MAAVHETGLLTALLTALPLPVSGGRSRLRHMLRTPLQALLLTLLFLAVVGLRRPWDLRGYTGRALALLTGRLWAFGYRHVERFLALLAQAGAAEPLTDALARWTTQLWHPPTATPATAPPLTVYIDGHRKPVYTDKHIPHGLIGRTGTVTGCRALVLLHDAHGHPLLATTTRGDQHLTVGLPQIVARYEQATGTRLINRIIVDREGMGGTFLAGLVADGRTVVTLLRTDQYTGIESFTAVGAFVPLTVDRHGTVLREVAPASFALALPEQPGTTLPLSVALIRDHRWQVPCPPANVDPPRRWDADGDPAAPCWWEEGWAATPAPAGSSQAKLIPIVSTAPTQDALALAQLYIQRWPRQENVIRDYLIPLGIDTNHGYAKTEVLNSEVAKQRTALEQRLARLCRWAASARQRGARAGNRYQRLWAATKARSTELYRALNQQQSQLEAQGVAPEERRQQIRALQARADAEIEARRVKIWQAYDQSNAEWQKQERYCREQRVVLRAIADLAARERQMYELDNRKDQVMTVCKVALTNLVQWTRDQYFPASYAHATWHRLDPFFRLAGQIRWEQSSVRVVLRPFNDRQLNRDLAELCTRIAAAPPQLPDGRQLSFTVSPTRSPVLDVYT